ncbi:MAG: cupin domain-containing protein [Janthinobacterium lividum]
MWFERVRVLVDERHLFKVAKGIGATNWHTHDDQEETFLLLRGELTTQLRSGDVELRAGDLVVIPRGVEHCPLAREEAHFMLIGPGRAVHRGGLLGSEPPVAVAVGGVTSDETARQSSCAMSWARSGAWKSTRSSYPLPLRSR